MKNEARNSIACTMRKYWLRALVLTCLAQPLLGAVEQGQVSQFGVTWTFDRNYTVGQFANGDYWVVGPVTVIGIHPSSVEISGRTMNGSMVNPSPKLSWFQGYDSGMYRNYGPFFDPNLNVGRPYGQDLSEWNPLLLQPHSSLVSSISIPEPIHKKQLDTAAILTVLSKRPPEGSFRPPYCGSDKGIRFNRNQLGYSVLANLKPVPGVPGRAEVERYFERPWLDHVPNWLGGYLHPGENMPGYGREMATQVGIGALMLNLDFTNQQKETLLIRLVQLGIDFYGIIQDEGEENWINSGGHASGRKWPILFAGLVLGDPNMMKIGRGDVPDYGPSHPEHVHFGEDDQTFYVTRADVDVTHSAQWNPDSRDTQKIPYEHEDIGLPEWGIRHATGPAASNKFWKTAYRQVCSPGWGGFVLAAHIMGMKDLWNHDALFDYTDRYMQAAVDWRQTSRFVEAMWDTYRADYGPVWTMSPKLTAVAAGGSVEKTPDKVAYTLGESVRIKAIADPGYEFAGWSGGLSGKNNPVSIVMHANRSIIANFSVSR
ncbi:MAG: hypothetical protein CEE38_05740 [Planctomycetes bacterium B3_Pla]|nr:MAG: hypothetical protein CEE38_05740 [Planctomycetes bacterium B3_Pla]